METKTAVKLANIAGRLGALGLIVEDSRMSDVLLTASTDVWEAIKADLPYSLKEEDL